ncbi:hypothetical protein [Desulfosarcina cetonica]|uniref:hypothetical protein n=1 Tax=Desulfosarcina cetonica TaxID=90730 RepID=UPI000B099DFD|nr:hypothetical protein [Desulfosarcina cetonica]
MNPDQLPDNPYLLLTPGPLSTTKTVKAAMLRDWCTWDADYNRLVQSVRHDLVSLAGALDTHTAVLMQGSGTFCVEATVTTAIPPTGKLLVLANGAYGRRIVDIARRCGIDHRVIDSGELAPPDTQRVDTVLAADPAITTWPWCTVKPPPACSTRQPRSPASSRPTGAFSSSTP